LAVVNVQLDNFKSSVNKVNSSILDRKSDKTNEKIDREVCLFIAGLMLKGGYDFFLLKPDQVKPKETVRVGK